MASGLVTKEIESRLKQIPEHIFEVFLEINQPINNEVPEILIKYPNDFSDHILKTAAIFAYPNSIPPDDQNEHFTFVVLDSNGLIFRFGYCRRSNRESTCLCLISYYPWFEIFYNILNDLSQIINSKSEIEMERFLSLLYNYKLMSIEEFYRKEGKELIEITNIYKYSRPDHRQLPTMSSNVNFNILFSQLNSDLILRLFAHLIFERRILFISSKLAYLTACTCGCLQLINPMHWQSIFLPILPESMIWTVQCLAPYIIGIHSSIYSKINKNELNDAVIVNIDKQTIQTSYDDLNLFPKFLIQKMKKDIQQSMKLIDDQLSRVFLRTMAFIIGNYANGFVMKNEKLDFDRDIYLQQYRDSNYYRLMFAVANTQMFEQFSRYRTYSQLEREIDIDEFDIEVKNLQQSKTKQKVYKIFEKTTSPVIKKPIQNKPEEMTKNLSSIQISDSNKLSDNNSLIDFNTDDLILPSTTIIETSSISQPCLVNPIVKQLVQQFDPLQNSSSVVFRSDINISERHPSINETIPINYVDNILQNLKQNSHSSSSDTNLIDFN